MSSHEQEEEGLSWRAPRGSKDAGADKVMPKRLKKWRKHKAIEEGESNDAAQATSPQRSKTGTEGRKKLDIEEIAKRMTVKFLDVSVQEEGCREVSSGLWDRFVSPSAVLSSGALNAVLSAMKRFKDAEVVQAKGCHILHHMCKTDSVARNVAATRGGIERVLAAVKGHPDNADVQSFGCGALWNLALAQGPAGEDTVKLGGVELVLKVLRAHPTAEKTQEYSIGALSGLLSNKRPAAVSAFCAGSGVDAVLTAMRAHKNNVYVQRNGCLVLAYACEASAECHKAFLAGEGLVLVTETLLNFHANDIAFDNVCRVIIALFTHELPPSALSPITLKVMSLLDSQCTDPKAAAGVRKAQTTHSEAARSKKPLCAKCIELLQEHRATLSVATPAREETKWEPDAPIWRPKCTRAHRSNSVDEDAALLSPENILQGIYGSDDDFDDDDDDDPETSSGESSSHSPVLEPEQDGSGEQAPNTLVDDSQWASMLTGAPFSFGAPRVQPQWVMPMSHRSILMSPRSAPAAVLRCLSNLEQRFSEGVVSGRGFVRYGDLHAVVTAMNNFCTENGVQSACYAVLRAAANQRDAETETMVTFARLKNMNRVADSHRMAALAAL